LLALYLGYIVAGQYHDKFFPFLRDISDNPKVVFLASYVILFIATYIIIMLLGKVLVYAVQISLVGWFDRFLGAILGFAKAMIVVVLMHMVLGTMLAPENQMLRTCQTCDVLNSAADTTRELIKSEDVRKALQQREPAISLNAVKEYLAPISSGIFDSGKKENENGGTKK
jgi:membrane protein required for colicin V production